jgi:ergothioneine biosynthesis protein EgtB
MTANAQSRSADADTISALINRYLIVRERTLALAEPLSAEDQQVQSMPDASPTKWHLAHTTWFFETFLLQPHLPDYRLFDDSFNYLFNSYYEQVGDRHPRPERGLLTRPALQQVRAWRNHVDEAMQALITARGEEPGIAALAVLGLHHEQQHQELLLTDIKHALSRNGSLAPAYRPDALAPSQGNALAMLPVQGGLVEIGTATDNLSFEEFAFDNEGPRHRVWLDDYRIASRPVTNAEYEAFIADGGYETPSLWLSDGLATLRERDWRAPLYWRDEGMEFTLQGLQPRNAEAPVCHLSYYEADAFARWAGKRLPTEAEWEHAVNQYRIVPSAAGDELVPGARAGEGLLQAFHSVWQWTASAYLAYPGFRPGPGAVGEYNGKFMLNQMVLRGSSCITAPGHSRVSYRNFFYPDAQWQFTGVRLAEDA